MEARPDPIDMALLKLVQEDATQSLRELGELVGLSAAAVQRRLSKLKTSGVISSTVSMLNQQRMSLPITIVTFITCERDDMTSTAALKTTLKALPEVQSFYELAGERDFVTTAVVPTMERYKELVDEVLDQDPNVLRYESHVVLDTIKKTHALPL